MKKDTRYYYFMSRLDERQAERSQMTMREDIPQDVKDAIMNATSDCNELLSMVLLLEDEVENGNVVVPKEDYSQNPQAFIEKATGKKMTPIQSETISDFLHYPKMFISGSRQIGFSTALIGLALWYATQWENKTIFLGSDRLSLKAKKDILIDFFNRISDSISTNMVTTTDGEIVFSNGTTIDLGYPHVGTNYDICLVDDAAFIPKNTHNILDTLQIAHASARMLYATTGFVDVTADVGKRLQQIAHDETWHTEYYGVEAIPAKTN